jgi:hypothetical protein
VQTAAAAQNAWVPTAGAAQPLQLLWELLPQLQVGFWLLLQAQMPSTAVELLVLMLALMRVPLPPALLARLA